MYVPKAKSCGHTSASKFRKWTEDDFDVIASMLENGATATQIAPRFGVGKGAICGIVRRTPRLSAIGFQRNQRDRIAASKLSPGDQSNRKLWTDDERAELYRMKDAGATLGEIALHFRVTKKAVIGQVKRRSDIASNIIRFPRSRTAKRSQAAIKADSRSRPKLRVIVNTKKLVDDWLRENGGARKFEPGFSADYLGMQRYLGDRGVTLGMRRGKLLLHGERGRPRMVSWDEVWAAADKFRVREGKTPILRAAR